MTNNKGYTAQIANKNEAEQFLAANPDMPFNIWIFLILFFFAAFLGDTSNFFIGHTAGYKLINHKFFISVGNAVNIQ